jgi:sulfite reductase (NADPH) flavoprotein alpha-component
MSEKKLMIIYGTETGNSELLSLDTSNIAKDNNFETTVSGMDEIGLEDLKSCDNLIIVCSTWGDGEQPDNAIELFEAVESSNIDYLENVNFAVLALGDTAFDLFCEAGIQWDEILEKKGAKRINDRIDCDVDYEDDAEEWIEETIVKFSNMD